MNNNSKLNSPFRLVLFILTIVLYACSSTENDSDIKGHHGKKYAMLISNDFDSAKVFFQSLIKELEDRPNNYSIIRKEFENSIIAFETSIAEKLDDINRLGKDGEITNAQVDEWMIKVEKSIPTLEYRRIQELLDSIESKVISE